MQSLVMTVIGRDRPGLVKALAAVIEEHGGNWEESRMAQLAGEFAGLLRVRVPAERAGDLERALGGLEDVAVVVARPPSAPPASRSRLLGLEVVGQDHPGIVHALAGALASMAVNVEELESEVTSAPMSGEPLFRARALLRAPAALDPDRLRGELERLAADLIVDIRLDEPQGD
jgi:glycine cleavage system regulatory protein